MNLNLPLSLLVYPLVGILIYWPCLNGEWIFDDKGTVEYAQHQFKWSWKWLIGGRQYRPLTLVSIALNKLWPGTRRSLHVTNVLIHAGTAMVVEQIARSGGSDEGFAFLAGLLCLVHPFGGNTISYIAGRASALSGLFGLCAVGLLVAGGPYATLCPLFLAAAFLAKEDGVAFGPLAVGVAAVSGQWLIGAIILMGGVALLFHKRKWFAEFQSRNGSETMALIGLPVALPQPQNAWTVAVENILRFPFWMFGIKQSPYHGSGIPVPGIPRGTQALFTLALSVFGFWAVPEIRIPLLLIYVGPWLVYLVCPVPEQIAEYRNYASVAGFALWLAPIADHFPYAWYAVLPVFALVTFERARSYVGPRAFWEVAAGHTSGDKSRAFGELGAYWWLMKGDLIASDIALKEAIRLNPKFGPAMSNRASVLFNKGETAAARTQAEECVRQCPKFAAGWETFGQICEKTGDLDAAESAYARGLGFPGNDRAANCLGLLAYRQNQLDSAGLWFDMALASASGDFRYLHNRACVHAKTGNGEKAVALVGKLGQYAFIPGDMIPPEAS